MIAVMDVWDVVLLVVALALLMFTLGALVAWRLEGRRPLEYPLWLAVTRNVSWIAIAAYVVVSGEPPTGIVTIDPFWWNLMEAVIIVGSLAILPLEVIQILRRRRAA